MQTCSFHFTLVKMSSPDYHNVYNGPAATQCFKDVSITYCLTLTFIVFCAFPLFMYFKDSIFWTLLHTMDSIHCITLYITHIFNTLSGLCTILNELQQLQPQDQQFQQPRARKALTQILPLLDEFLAEEREQLTIFPSTEQASPIQEIKQECCDSQEFEMEQFFLHTPHIFMEHIYAPPVVCNDHTFTEFIQGEERCFKFISQDLTFLECSSIPSTFRSISNTDGSSEQDMPDLVWCCIWAERVQSFLDTSTAVEQ